MTMGRHRLVLAAVLVLLSGACALSAQGMEPVRDPVTGEINSVRVTGTMDFQIESFLNAVAATQGFKFLLSERSAQVKNQTVTIVAPPRRPDGEGGFIIPKGAFFSVLQAMLKTKNFILAPFGEDTATSVRFYELVPINEAITSSRAEDVHILNDIGNLLENNEFNDDGAGFKVLIAQLKWTNSGVVRAALQNFVTRNSGLVAPIQGPRMNALVIADYAFNVRRMAKIISMLDQPPDSPRMEIIPVNYMDAEELAIAVDDLISRRKAVAATPGNEPGSIDDSVDITVAPNVNALLVQGFDKGIDLVQKLVKQLDQKIPGSDITHGRVHYYQARNVEAARLATSLQSLLNEGIILQPSAPVDGAPPPPIAANQDPQANVPIIVPDEITNTLLIICKPTEFNEILKILQKIDVRQPQVMIEAVVLEVTSGDSFDFGVEIASVDGAGTGLRGQAATSFGFSTIVDSSGAPIDTAGGAPAGRLPDFGAGGIFALTNGGAFRIPLLIRFLRTQSEINILSAPRILVAMGEAGEEREASIRISTEVGLSSTSSTSISNITSQAGTASDGIDFTATPTVISEDGYITLDVSLNVDKFTEQPGSSGIQPPKTVRSILTRVTVPDGQTVAIGGLQGAQSTKTVSKVPFIGDIPILGEFFKRTTTSRTRTNLYVFIRPVVYRDRDFSDLLGRSHDELISARDKLKAGKESKIFLDKAIKDNEAARKVEPGKLPRVLALEDLPNED